MRFSSTILFKHWHFIRHVSHWGLGYLCLQTLRYISAQEGDISLTWNHLPSYTLSPTCVRAQYHTCQCRIAHLQPSGTTMQSPTDLFVAIIWPYEKKGFVPGKVFKIFFMGINNDEIYYDKGRGGSTAANKFSLTTRLLYALCGRSVGFTVLLYPALSEATDLTS